MRTIKTWLVTIVVLLCSLTASAHDFEVDGIYYNIISSSDLTVEVTNGDNKYCGDVIVPPIVTYRSKDLTVVGIGSSAFGGCDDLISITIPNSVINIGNHAFYGCDSLKNVIIEDGETVLSLGYNYHTTSDKYEGESLFYDCPLTNVYLGRNLGYYTGRDYGYSLFYEKYLESLIVGPDVTTIDDYSFNGCSGISSLRIEDGEKPLWLGYNHHKWSQYDEQNGEGLFYDCTLGCVYIGRDLEYYTDPEYGYSPFRGVSGIVSLTIGDSVKNIGKYAFNSCEYMRSATIGNSVTSIGEYAFGGCKKLTNITLPNSVTIIEEGAFGGCSGLDSVIIGNSVTSIGERAFGGCSGLTNFIIPNSVTSIGDYAFNNCSNLTSISIPGSVKHIPLGAFENCTKITNVTIENGITYIYSNAFKGCNNLTNVVIPSSVKNIYDSFVNCSGLTSITIGNGVTSIGKAFSGCYGLESIYMEGLPPTKANGDFTQFQYANIALHVPQGFLAAYQTAEVWKDFWGIQEYYLDKYFYINYIINGELYAVDSVKHGDTIIPKEIPEREGLTFSGWLDLPETMPANDITVNGTINIEPNEVVLNTQTIVTTVNGVYQLHATVYPEDATDKTVIWTSSDESVAKVSDSGYVTGISVGRTIIAATCGNVSASCEVEVEAENFIKTQPTSENLLVELNTPEEGVKYQWYRLVEGMIYSKEIVPISSGEYAWTESNGVWTSGNNKEGPQTFSVMTATVRVQLGDTISFDYTVPKGDGRNDGGSQWFKFTLKGETNMLTFGGVNGGAGHYELDINDYIIDRKLNEDSTMTVGFECVRKNSERATVSNIKHTRPTGFYRGMVAEEIIGATTARLQDSLFVEGSVVYCVATLPNGRTLTSDKVNMYKVYYYVGEELVHVAEVPYGEVIPEYVYEPTNEDDEFLGWIGETYETMPAHDVTYTANIESGINQLLLDNGQLIIYDLMGRKVLNMENLKGGIYIVNGKKVVFK